MLYFMNLLMEAIDISEETDDIKKRQDKLKEDITYALKKKLITKQDAEEMNEIAGLKMFE